MESASQIDRLPLDDRLAAGGAAPARIVSTPHPGRAKARRLRRKSKKLKLRSHYPPTTLRGYAQARGVNVRKVLWWLRNGYLPPRVGAVRSTTVSLARCGYLQGLTEDCTRRLYRRGLLPIGVMPRQFNQPRLGRCRRQQLVTLKQSGILETMLIMRYLDGRLKEARGRLTEMRQAWEKRRAAEEQRLGQMAREFEMLREGIRSRDTLLERLKYEVEAGRVIDNAKSIEQIVRFYLSDDQWEQLEAKRRSGIRQKLNSKIRRKARRAARRDGRAIAV
jgi:hypothetical protein